MMRRNALVVALALLVGPTIAGNVQAECVRGMSITGPIDNPYRKFWPADSREFLLLTYHLIPGNEETNNIWHPFLINGIYGINYTGFATDSYIYFDDGAFLVIGIDQAGNALMASCGIPGGSRNFNIYARAWLQGAAPPNLCEVLSWDLLVPSREREGYSRMEFTLADEEGGQWRVGFSFRFNDRQEGGCPDPGAGQGPPGYCWEGTVTTLSGPVGSAGIGLGHLKGRFR